MDENETMLEVAEGYTPTPEEQEEEERRREAEHEAMLKPFKYAAQQRRESAQIVAEHDDLLAEMLFEITMNQFEQEG